VLAASRAADLFMNSLKVLYTLRDHSLLLALVESKQEVRNKKNNHELNLEKMAKCTATTSSCWPMVSLCKRS
jgi:hypothetical protein